MSFVSHSPTQYSKLDHHASQTYSAENTSTCAGQNLLLVAECHEPQRDMPQLLASIDSSVVNCPVHATPACVLQHYKPLPKLVLSQPQVVSVFNRVSQLYRLAQLEVCSTLILPGVNICASARQVCLLDVMLPDPDICSQVVPYCSMSALRNYYPA